MLAPQGKDVTLFTAVFLAPKIVLGIQNDYPSPPPPPKKPHLSKNNVSTGEGSKGCPKSPGWHLSSKEDDVVNRTLKGGVIWDESFHLLHFSLLKNGVESYSVCIKKESIHEIPLETVRYYSNGKPWTGMPKTWPPVPALCLNDDDIQY